MAGNRVSSGDFLRTYGPTVERAMRHPVVITAHGRDRLVLLAYEEYKRLKALDLGDLEPDAGEADG